MSTGISADAACRKTCYRSEPLRTTLTALCQSLQLPAICTNESPLITTTTHAEICARVLALRDNGAPDICASAWGTPTLRKENKCARAVSIEHNYVKYLSLARSRTTLITTHTYARTQSGHTRCVKKNLAYAVPTRC